MKENMQQNPRKNRSFSRFVCLILALVLVMGVPFAVLAASVAAAPDAYGETYYAALKLKYQRLAETPGSRVVVIGGSSAAFGIDSKIVEQELGIPCVNFGLYAAFGLKCMLDLSLPELNRGDIVVIAPEYSSQMFSDYVGYSYLLQAMEGSPKMYAALGGEYMAGLLESMPSFLSDKRELAATGGLKPSGVYARSAFDSYGDIIYDRPENIMDGMVSGDNLPQIGPEIVTNSFADMINDYTAQARAKGASVYFGFCPVNAFSVELAEDIDLDGFQQALEEKLDCEILSSLDDHILDAGYFYDSNFHMNNAGVVCNTVLLVNDIKRVQGNMTQTATKIPKPVAGSASGEVISSGTEQGFHYDITASGAVITGLDETGLAAQKLTVPSSLGGFAVYKLAAGAFKGCAAEVIEIPECVSVLSAGLFAESANLKKVYLNSEKLPEVGDGLMNGAAEGVQLCVPETLYGDYVTDYFWTRYSDFLCKQ